MRLNKRTYSSLAEREIFYLRPFALQPRHPLHEVHGGGAYQSSDEKVVRVVVKLERRADLARVRTVDGAAVVRAVWREGDRVV